jgi:hypothetical protein
MDCDVLPLSSASWMEEENMHQGLKQPFLIVVALLAAMVFKVPVIYAQETPGTIGVTVVQLFNEGQANKRGVLVVRRVAPGSSAEEAGIEPGDVIIAVDGKNLNGLELSAIWKAGLRGAAGATVKLLVVKAKTDKPPVEIVVPLRPYPPHVNPAADVFGYSVPGDWQMDLRYPFPLPWSPSIEHKGLEDLGFAPGFDDLTSPEYHSYLIVWWLEGTAPLTAQGLESDMVAYFRGLAEQRGRNNHFTPDLTKVAAEYHEAAEGPRSFGGEAAKEFAGVVTLYDRHGSVITLHSEVVTSVCPADGHRAVFFSMSKEPRPAALWTRLDAVRDGFRCAR